LTAFGAEVIKDCNRLGILVDMAHATPHTVLGALKVATQPILYSHTGLDTRLGANPRMGEMMKPHLISKEHAKIIADAGGVVGVWTKLADSPKEFVENIRAMVDAIGIDHVGVGTDTDLLSSKVGQGTNKAWPNLTAGFFNATVAAMVSEGFTTEEIGKVGGGNYCRILGKATAAHAQAALRLLDEQEPVRYSVLGRLPFLGLHRAITPRRPPLLRELGRSSSPLRRLQHPHYRRLPDQCGGPSTGEARSRPAAPSASLIAPDRPGFLSHDERLP
jgi:hypothetical protein